MADFQKDCMWRHMTQRRCIGHMLRLTRQFQKTNLHRNRNKKKNKKRNRNKMKSSD